MKQIYLVVLLFFVAFGLVTIVVSGAHPALAADDPELGPCLEAIFSEIAPGELSAEEEAGILYMREEEKLARDGAIMSEAARRKLERDILSRKRDLRRALDELREDRTFRSNEERGKLLRYVNDAITEVGKQEKYDLILYEGIAFANPNIDLTGMILKRLQNEAKAKK